MGHLKNVSSHNAFNSWSFDSLSSLLLLILQFTIYPWLWWPSCGSTHSHICYISSSSDLFDQGYQWPAYLAELPYKSIQILFLYRLLSYTMVSPSTLHAPPRLGRRSCSAPNCCCTIVLPFLAYPFSTAPANFSSSCFTYRPKTWATFLPSCRSAATNPIEQTHASWLCHE